MYQVNIKFYDKQHDDLEGKFYAVVIDNNSEMLMLFRDITHNHSYPAEKILRYSIPLNDIESMEVIPLHEDNGQKISSC